jgi:hypothetical protein
MHTCTTLHNQTKIKTKLNHNKTKQQQKQMVKQVCSNCFSGRVTETTLSSSYSSIRTCIWIIEAWYTSNEIVRTNTNISSSILLSFSINTYLYTMLLSEETLRYPAAYCCPSPLIHTCTI